MKFTKFLWLDLETTGLNPDTELVCEVAARLTNEVLHWLLWHDNHGRADTSWQGAEDRRLEGHYHWMGLQMSFSEMYLAASAAIMCCITAYLVFSCEYEDGLIGRVALAAIFFAEAVLVADALSDTRSADMYKVMLVGQFGVTLFFIRHIYRFTMWQLKGKHDWRKAKK